jgi:hypothetical protein
MHREVTGAFSVPAFPWTSTVVLISHFPGWTLTPAARAAEAVAREAAKQSRATIASLERVGRGGAAGDHGDLLAGAGARRDR